MTVKEYTTKLNNQKNTYLVECAEHICNECLDFPQKCFDFINQALTPATYLRNTFMSLQRI